MSDLRHKVCVPLDDPGVPSSDHARREEAALANAAYMERVTIFARPLANDARVTMVWALRCLANSRMPLG